MLMPAKILAIVGSVRFWIIVLTAVLAVLNGQPVIETIQVALGAVVALGTFDSIASRAAGTKV
jgi:hypothetical protein